MKVMIEPPIPNGGILYINTDHIQYLPPEYHKYRKFKPLAKYPDIASVEYKSERISRLFYVVTQGDIPCILTKDMWLYNHCHLIDPVSYNLHITSNKAHTFPELIQELREQRELFPIVYAMKLLE